MKPMRNIGIFAHVDAGKTTLTEQMLKVTGAIRTAGSVDQGTAHTDDLPVEQRRGISVRASVVAMEWKGVTLHLIDTPGHVDFVSEIERASWALDGAVLVLSAVEGVQPQTELLFHTFQRQKIPMVLFINKTDRIGADVARVLQEIQDLLSANAVCPADEERLLDVVSSLDDAVMETWLEEGTVPAEQTSCRTGITLCSTDARAPRPAAPIRLTCRHFLKSTSSMRMLSRKDMCRQSLTHCRHRQIPAQS